MSVESILADIGGDLKSAAEKVAGDWKKVKAAWNLICSPEVRAALVAVGAAAVTAINASEAAIAADGFNLTLDVAVANDIKNLIADAKAGEGVIATDLKALGVNL
jgi:hypothetical protein